MKLINSIILFIFMATTFTAAAGNKDPNYYEDEGKLLFKLRPLFANTNASQKNFSIAQNPGTKAPESFVENGFGFDTATTYFFADNFAAELSLGVVYYKAKKSAFSTVSTSFGDGKGKVGKKLDIFMLPASGTVQYHIAPFGAIRPYVGAGLHGTYIYTRAKEYKMDNGHGFVFQAGVDFISKDDTFITLDIRHYTLDSKITYKSAFLNRGKDVTSKIKLNPTIFSIGFGFAF